MRARRLSWRRAGPTLLAAVLALAYLIAAPRSPDLADALFRVHLFRVDPFGIWDNLWYSGHNLPGYSVLMPPLGWLFGARLLGALATVATAAAGGTLAQRHDPERGWLPALWFAAGSATELMSGRIAFVLGFLFVALVAVALQQDRRLLAPGLALVAALASPVAALFAALVGATVLLAPSRVVPASGDSTSTDPAAADPGMSVELTPPGRRLAGAATVVAALLPVGILNVAFPQGGTEPFAASAFWPMPVLGGLVLAAALRARRPTVATGAVLYVLGTVAAFVLPTAVGGNAVRLGQLAAGPIVLALVLVADHPLSLRSDPRPDGRARSKRVLAAGTALAVLAVALVYLQWQGALRDTIDPASDPSTTAAYYAPVLHFLADHDGAAARTEIVPTKDHWEAYWVGRRFALARGWERQLDERDNSLFYRAATRRDPDPLTPARYDRWLHASAVRWVALPLHVPLDGSAHREAAIVEEHPRFLRLALATKDWRVYAVRRPTPLASGAARVTRQTQSTVFLIATRVGETTVRIRFSPYWEIAGMPGCLAPDGPFISLSTTRRGRFALRIDFALDRVGARSARCTQS